MVKNLHQCYHGNFDTNYIICKNVEIFIKKNFFQFFFFGVNENREYFEYSGFDMEY